MPSQKASPKKGKKNSKLLNTTPPPLSSRCTTLEILRLRLRLRLWLSLSFSSFPSFLLWSLLKGRVGNANREGEGEQAQNSENTHCSTTKKKQKKVQQHANKFKKNPSKKKVAKKVKKRIRKKKQKRNGKKSKQHNQKVPSVPVFTRSPCSVARKEWKNGGHKGLVVPQVFSPSTSSSSESGTLTHTLPSPSSHHPPHLALNNLPASHPPSPPPSLLFPSLSLLPSHYQNPESFTSCHLPPPPLSTHPPPPRRTPFNLFFTLLCHFSIPHPPVVRHCGGGCRRNARQASAQCRQEGGDTAPKIPCEKEHQRREGLERVRG
eukprot:Rhum_TRINITY_DN11367_c2_g1::Rhum_TRINITY_DN11367_c2_g1_i1::g.44200::m.44200